MLWKPREPRLRATVLHEPRAAPWVPTPSLRPPRGPAGYAPVRALTPADRARHPGRRSARRGSDRGGRLAALLGGRELRLRRLAAPGRRARAHVHAPRPGRAPGDDGAVPRPAGGRDLPVLPLQGHLPGRGAPDRRGGAGAPPTGGGAGL